MHASCTPLRCILKKQQKLAKISSLRAELERKGQGQGRQRMSCGTDFFLPLITDYCVIHKRPNEHFPNATKWLSVELPHSLTPTSPHLITKAIPFHRHIHTTSVGNGTTCCDCCWPGFLLLCYCYLAGPTLHAATYFSDSPIGVGLTSEPWILQDHYFTSLWRARLADKSVCWIRYLAVAGISIWPRFTATPVQGKLTCSDSTLGGVLQHPLIN